MTSTIAAPTESELDVESGEVTIRGTLMTPAGGAKGVALILPGSGPVDRDANLKRLRLGVSRDLAVALAARGIASYRYDKRGVGASTGHFLTAGLADNAADAAAALEALVDAAGAQPVFVIGHSEGGILAERIAAEHPGLVGVVLLAAPGKPGIETMRWQARQIAGSLPAFARIVTRLFRIDIVAQQAKNVDRLLETTSDVVRMQGRRINAKWQRELLQFDPVPYLSRITAPVLAITGGKDLQVDPDDLEIIRRSVPAHVEIDRPADLTHLLRDDAGAPSVGNYKQLLRRPTEPAILDRVAGWVAAHA